MEAVGPAKAEDRVGLVMSFSNLVKLDKISLFMACLSGYERKIIHIDSLLHFRD